MVDRAVLVHDGRAFVATHAPTAPGRPAAPTSAIVKLVQGIYEVEPPERALRIVRARILATAQPTPMCRGTVKIAARRLTAPVPDEEVERTLLAARERVDVTAAGTPPFRDARPIAIQPPAEDTDAAWLAAARRAAAAVAREGPRFRADRPVAALLVSREGRLLAAATNANGRNRTLHAEVNLVQAAGRLPAGARVYSTLEPCKMCAGFIWCAAEDVASLRVRWLDDDPGSGARETCLHAGTNARRAAARAAHEVSLAIAARFAADGRDEPRPRAT